MSNDDDFARYIRDLARVGCRVTFEPQVKPHRVLHIKAERLTEHPWGGTVVAAFMERVVTEHELEGMIAGPKEPILNAVREMAQTLAESI